MRAKRKTNQAKVAEAQGRRAPDPAATASSRRRGRGKARADIGPLVEGAAPAAPAGSACFVEGGGGGGGTVENGFIVFAADPGVGAAREALVELWDDKSWTKMSDAETYAFEIALGQTAPACNVNLAHGPGARSQGDAGPPIAGTQTTGQTAVAAQRHDDLPSEDSWRAYYSEAGGAGPEARAQPSRADDATDGCRAGRPCWNGRCSRYHSAGFVGTLCIACGVFDFGSKPCSL